MNNATENTNIDALVKTAVFGSDQKAKEEARQEIRDMAAARGIRPASIQELYEASGQGKYSNITVPAINIRGIAYETARAVFRAALKDNVGALIFEIARSEIGYTKQAPNEYTACVMAAAMQEGYQGPVFIQGDHFQVNRKKYGSDTAAETSAMKDLIKEAIEAGFYNIDIDASTLVDIEKEDLVEQQTLNSQVTAELTKYIRDIEPEGVTVSVGGEIGEIGKGNSTVADLQAFMKGYQDKLGEGIKGISKISVQTGTSHGGVVMPDGSIAKVKIDFEVLRELSEVAKKEYGMGGAVQHGASTLPDEAFDMFPKADTLEVHLATGFQNIIYDSEAFPDDLRQEIYAHLAKTYSGERKESETEEQFVYKTRKRALGDYKTELWNLPKATMDKIMSELENRFTLMFRKLNAVNTTDLVAKYITNY